MHLFPRRLAAACLSICSVLFACSGDDGEVGSDHGARSVDPGRVASTSQAMTTNEIMARADEYIAAKVPYCGGVRGGTDYICGGTCSRPSAPWNNYRSDCSGFVSWCWQIASNPTTATFMDDVAGTNGWTTIGIDDLRPGDAVVADGHIKLFSKFIDSDTAEIYEEYSCGNVGRKAVQNFTRSGGTLNFGSDVRVYHPIRRNGVTLSTLKGAVEAAATTIDGWAIDTMMPDAALSVDVYVDGTKGAHAEGKADIPRPDVATAQGIGPNHGFSIPTPLYYCDALSHPLSVYAGAGAAIATTTKTVVCPVPQAIAGILRHVADPSSLATWKLDVRTTLRWITAEDRADYVAAAELPAEPVVGTTSDGRAWLVDGGARRLIVDPKSVAAWGFALNSLEPLSAADAALAEGLPLPSKPVLVQVVGAPAVFLLDVDPAHPTQDPGSDTPVYMSSSGRRRYGADTADACAVARAPGAGASAGLGWVAALAGAAIARRRRSRRASRTAR